jgi:hypothetical protein
MGDRSVPDFLLSQDSIMTGTTPNYSTSFIPAATN